MREKKPGAYAVWAVAILGLLLGGIQVFGNLARAAAEEDWDQFDRLLSWLWITIAGVAGLTAVILIAINLVMLPFWRMRAALRRRFPDLPVHLAYESTQSSGASDEAIRNAVGPFSVVITASLTGLKLWRGRDQRVVLELPTDRIRGVEFECARWRRPMMRVELIEPEATLLFALADELALGLGGSSPRKAEKIIAEINEAICRTPSRARSRTKEKLE